MILIDCVPFSIKQCIVYYIEKSKNSLKTIDVKPIDSTENLCRAHLDLKTLAILNLQVNLSPDGVTAYRYLMVYLNHFTKKIYLTSLKRKLERK